MARKSVVNQQDATKATLLRKQGCTYNEIVVRMEGKVTLDWCKLSLKHVKEDSPESRAKHDIYMLATRPEGVTYTECCDVLLANEVCVVVEHEENGEDMMYTAYKRIKDSLKGKYKDDVVFRPMWMRPDDSIGSVVELNTLADLLNRKFEEAVDEYMQDVFPDKYNDSGIRKSLSHELARIAIPFKSAESVLSICARNTKMAEMLQERVEQKKKDSVHTEIDQVSLNWLPF